MSSHRIAADALLAKKQCAAMLQPWQERERIVRDFLCAVQLFQPSLPSSSSSAASAGGLSVEIVPLHDMYGPAVVVSDLNAIIVSRETLSGGESVNKVRLQNGLPASSLPSLISACFDDALRCIALHCADCLLCSGVCMDGWMDGAGLAALEVVCIPLVEYASVLRACVYV